MTTTNKTLLAALMQNEELAGNPALKDFITTTLEAAGRKSNTKNPDKEIDGILHKYCQRHDQYEPITGWKGHEEYVSDNKRIDASCDIAVAHWRELTKELKALEKDIPNYMGDAVALQNHMMAVESKRTERAGKYKYPADGDLQKETAAEEQEEAAPIKPKRGRTRASGAQK